MTDDIVARAKAALEGIETPKPWAFHPWERGKGSSKLLGAQGVHMAWDLLDGDGGFIAQSPELVAELVAEVERLRSDPTLALMGSQLEKLATERDELRATVGRVRAYLDRRVRATAWAETAPCVSPREIEIFHFEIRDIRSALGGDNQSGDPS